VQNATFQNRIYYSFSILMIDEYKCLSKVVKVELV